MAFDAGKNVCGAIADYGIIELVSDYDTVRFIPLYTSGNLTIDIV